MTTKEFCIAMLSEPGGTVSFGRCACAVALLYFLAQDAWFFHRLGSLVDNATLMTQLTFASSYYVTNRVTAIFKP